MTLAKEHNAEAFEQLVNRARPLCLTIARSILSDETEAEDQVQNALFKAWRNIDQFRQDASFHAWLFRIVTNECLMLFRKRGRLQQVSLDDGSPHDSNQLVVHDSRADPEEMVASEEIERLLSRELGRVPKVFRTVLLMVEVQGLSMDEMSRELGISIPAVKSRLIRARRELRNRVNAHSGRMGLATLLS